VGGVLDPSPSVRETGGGSTVSSPVGKNEICCNVVTSKVPTEIPYNVQVIPGTIW